MSVSIKVCIRCRPFTIDDKLGVVMQQNSEESGEVNLINSSYSTNRFAFTYSWWSAYGYDRHVLDSPPEAEQMKLINQEDAYKSCGHKVKADLYGGNAVVLFAYGLSGSGKTFTVFGPDAVDIPEAWFKHATPHPLWGIFPRLAYELFQDKEDGWKISMKYFQNVVDTVRDLMSPMAKEQQYKSGMRKDPDGFMDIEWCQSVVLRDWDHLRQVFRQANARKAIAPTQFNHQSTRGHCIMTLEVEKPDPERPGMKQRGRLYVCDLAGTEPAGDICYAEYKKVKFENGDIEYKFTGAHPDPAKSKELQDQGKKINLSLTEMSQFFMKMAQAVKAKKLKPGASIPGCNSYFLCKYLKDTMLQARTYLFCAIRPEVKYHSYTFSTLGFATNASVIKLQPKKATTAASAAERKLMAELDQMKLLVQQLQEANSQINTTGAGDSSKVDELNAILTAKQKELESVLTGGEDGGNNNQEEEMNQQREEYGQRGIALAYFESETTSPHLINLDVDGYRSRRFIFILEDNKTISIGSDGDIQPMSLSIVPGHCSINVTGDVVTLISGAGDVVHNGTKVTAKSVVLTHHDRVVIGNELMLFIDPRVAEPDTEPLSADEAAREYQRSLTSASGNTDDEKAALADQLRKFEEEKAAWEAQKAQAIAQGASAEELAATEVEQQAERDSLARQINDQELRDVLPKLVELKKICGLLNRDMLSFDTALQGSGRQGSGVPKVKVKVHNALADETIFLDTFEFVKAHALLKDEVSFLRNAISNERSYAAPEGHDPISLLFDNTCHLGNAIIFPEYLVYNLETDPEESHANIKLAVPPFSTVGKIEVTWTPLSGPEDNDEDDTAPEIPDVEDPSDLLGKPWTYRINIKSATGLPIITDMAYCQYEFFGELFTTETVEQNSRSPDFGYSFVHHIDCVTQSFLDYLQQSRIEILIFASPFVMDPPKDKISTDNPVIVQNFGGTPVVKVTYEDLQTQVKTLEDEKLAMTQELEFLRQQFKEMTGGEAPVFSNSPSKSRLHIQEAIATDSVINKNVSVDEAQGTEARPAEPQSSA